MAAAQYFLRNDPSHPGAYLLLRALRWGELRNQTADVGELILPAPSPATRIALRMRHSPKIINRSREVAESAMSTDVGRGWLDLHRYVIVAADKLSTSRCKGIAFGTEGFLQEFPQLHTATLSDDTGTANPETLAWLQRKA